MPGPRSAPARRWPAARAVPGRGRPEPPRSDRTEPVVAGGTSTARSYHRAHGLPGWRSGCPAPRSAPARRQHETDHLDGILFIDRMDTERRKAAMKAIREAPWNGKPAPRVRLSPHPIFGRLG
ncbi:hypothetical protein HC028_18195 [Planosporangium flavigriseum]|nr:hypothetical protein [Planosporangium flavigriseum]